MLNPAVMRWLDRWVGQALCAVVSGVDRARQLTAPAGRRGAPPAPRRVLLIELAEMGSLVLARPAVDRLRRLYPDSEVFFLVFPNLVECVRVLDLAPADHVFTIDPSNPWTIVRDTLAFVRTARAYRIDTAIALESFARFSTLLAYLSGAVRRVGFHPYTQPGLYVGSFLTHNVLYNPHIHTAQAYLALVNALSEPEGRIPLGKTPVEALPSLPPLASTPDAQQRVLERLRARTPGIEAATTIVVINPNASSLIEIRKWPLGHYARLVKLLLDGDDGTYVILTGLASEGADARFIVDRVASPRVIDFTGQTSVRDLVDLFHLADLVISNDSGPAHLAALAPTPSLVFFGPETPVLYRPLSDRCTVMYAHLACSPCVSAFNQRVTPCRDNRCLQVIDPTTVYERVQALLRHRTARRSGAIVESATRRRGSMQGGPGRRRAGAAVTPAARPSPGAGRVGAGPRPGVCLIPGLLARRRCRSNGRCSRARGALRARTSRKGGARRRPSGDLPCGGPGGRRGRLGGVRRSERSIRCRDTHEPLDLAPREPPARTAPGAGGGGGLPSSADPPG